MKFNGFLKRTIISWIVVIIFFVLLIVLIDDIYEIIKYLFKLFLPFIIAYVVSLSINPLAEKLYRKLKIPKGVGAVALIVLVVATVGSILFFAVFKIVSEVRDLYLSLPTIYQNSTEYIKSVEKLYMSFPDGIRTLTDNIIGGIKTDISVFFKKSYPPVMTFAKNFAIGIPNIFFVASVFIISLYFMISKSDKINEKIKKLIPDCMKKTMKNSTMQIKKYFGGYLKAQLILMFVALVIMFVGFLILDVKYSLLLALGIALFDALPFFGTVMILIPWSVIGFLNQNLSVGIGMVVIYIVLVTVRELIEPKIVSTNIGISPLLTLVSIYVGFRVFSIGGMILGPFVLMLLMSLYTAGVFREPIKLVKKLYNFLIKESKKIFKNITMR